MSHLEQKIEKMERRMRVYQAALLTIILAGGALFFTSFNRNPVADLVQAKEFQVVDDYGKVFASMKYHDGYCDFKLFNGKGSQIVRLTESTNGYGAILTFDKLQNPAWKVTGTTGNGGGSMSLFNSNAKEIISLTNTTQGGGTVWINNTEGDLIAEIGQSVSRQGSISLYNRTKVRTCVLGSDGDGNGALNIYNSSGLNQNGVWPAKN